MAFSLTEKLAVTGAFLALVAMVVGTEDDPGVVVTGQEVAKELRPDAPLPAPSAEVPQPVETRSEIVEPQPALTEPGLIPEPSPPTQSANPPEFNAELGRVPLDLSKGPPAG